MSASREKKQRIASTGGGLTDKQRREAAEAGRAKTKAVLYTVLGVVAAVLVILLLLWSNGLFTKGKVVATVGGQNFNVTELGFFYNSNSMLNMYRQYGIQVDEEMAAEFRQQAVESLHNTAALCAAAKAENFTLSGEGEEQVDQVMESIRSTAVQQGTTFNTYIRNAYGQFMNEKTLRKCFTMVVLADEYQQAYLDTLTYSEDQIGGYYDEHAAELDSFTYSAAFINGAPADAADAEGNAVEPTDAEKATAMSVAKAAADKLSADGRTGDFDALAQAATDGDDKSSAIPQTTALGSSLSGSFSTGAADCVAWLTDSARESGDTAAIEVPGEGYWVLKFERRFLDEDAWGDVDVRHILVKAEVAEGAEEPTAEAMEAAKAQAQDILDQFSAGGRTAEDFAALAREYSEDPGSKEEGGLYEHVTRGTNFFADFKNWIFDDARKSGDTGLVENTQSGQQGWHVMYLDKQNELQWRYTAVNALKSADLTTWTEGIEGTYAVETNEANLALVK